MSDLKLLDVALGDALDSLVQSTQLMKSDGRESVIVLRKDVAGVINKIWEVREQLYRVSPDLISETVLGSKQLEDSYVEQMELYEYACSLEEAGDFYNARVKFESLRGTSRSAYFVQAAQAGLYRVSTGK